jgi:hypothetical protein
VKSWREREGSMKRAEGMESFSASAGEAGYFERERRKERYLP